jgi:hypothetical protein
MALYDLDRFRVRVFENGLLDESSLDDAGLDHDLFEQAREDDIALLRMGHAWVKRLFP